MHFGKTKIYKRSFISVCQDWITSFIFSYVSYLLEMFLNRKNALILVSFGNPSLIGVTPRRLAPLNTSTLGYRKFRPPLYPVLTEVAIFVDLR